MVQLPNLHKTVRIHEINQHQAYQHIECGERGDKVSTCMSMQYRVDV